MPTLPSYMLDAIVVNTPTHEYEYKDLRVYRWVSDAIHGLRRKHPDYTSMVIVILAMRKDNDN